MKRFILIILVLVLPACGTLPPTVDVPVALPCPVPPQVARPHLAIRGLTPASPPADVIRAYAESLEAVAGYARQMETLLDGYRGGTGGR